MKPNPKYLMPASVALLVVVAVLWATGGFTTIASWLGLGGHEPPVPSGFYDDFAKCLTQKGAVMYGLATCSHCLDQKKMFGSSFQYVTYVECSIDSALCQSKGVESVPVWEITGSLITPGAVSLTQLSVLTSCPLALS
jgi:hypothetical protein